MSAEEDKELAAAIAMSKGEAVPEEAKADDAGK